MDVSDIHNPQISAGGESRMAYLLARQIAESKGYTVFNVPVEVLYEGTLAEFNRMKTMSGQELVTYVNDLNARQKAIPREELIKFSVYTWWNSLVNQEPGALPEETLEALGYTLAKPTPGEIALNQSWFDFVQGIPPGK